MSNQPMSFEQLSQRIQQAQILKKASAEGGAVPDVKDPKDKGTSAQPTPEAINETKLNPEIPESSKPGSKNPESLEDKTAGVLEESQLPAGPTPEHPQNLPTGDYAKKASAIVSRLKERMAKSASAEDTAEVPAEPKAAEAATPEKKEEEQKKVATTVESELPAAFTHDFHIKLASTLLATEAGREHARAILAEAASVEAVDNLIKSAHAMEQKAQEAAAFEQTVKSAMAGMSEGEREKFIKSAEEHQKALESYTTEFEKAAYTQGAMDAAAMAEAGGEVPAIPTEADALSPEEIVMVVDQLVQSGQLDPALAEQILMEVLGEGQLPSIEQVAAELQELVQTGQLDPASAEEILMQVAAMSEGQVDPAAGAVDPAAEAAMADELAKSASAKSEVDKAIEEITAK